MKPIRTITLYLSLAMALTPAALAHCKTAWNPDHLKILNRGSTAWNSWRKKNPDTVPNLSGAVLTNRVLENFDFRKARLVKTDFTGCRMSYIRLEGADLRRAKLNNIRIRKLYLDGADLRGASLNSINRRGRRARKTYARMRGANLTGATIRNCHLHEGKMDRAVFRNADLSGTTISWSDCKGSDFRGATLTGTTLFLVDLTGSKLQNCTIKNSLFKYVNLKKARLEGARFSGSILGINLDQAKLKDNSFNRCYFHIVREGYSRMLGNFLTGWKSVDRVDIGQIRLAGAILPDFLKTDAAIKKHRDYSTMRWHPKIRMGQFIRIRLRRPEKR